MSFPTFYPFDLFARLYVVGTLERLGIVCHFRMEIQTVLDERYRYWVQRDGQIFTDIVTCALAFRVLRINGYEVSSVPLAEITKEGAFKDVCAALEVYKSSQVIYQDDLASGEQNFMSTDFVKRKISVASIPSNRLAKEVDNALKFPFNACLERVPTRRNIEYYSVDDSRISKTKYRWVVENRLDQLKFVRQKTAYCYFSVAATLSSPELSDARISWAKSSILATIIDGFFDVGGSMDELANPIHCVEKYNINISYYHPYLIVVKTLFEALMLSTGDGT